MDKTCAFCLNWDGSKESYMAECLAKAGMQRRTRFDETCRAWTPGIDEEPKTTRVALNGVQSHGPYPVLFRAHPYDGTLFVQVPTGIHRDSIRIVNRCIDCGKPFYGEYGLGLCKDCLGRWI